MNELTVNEKRARRSLKTATVDVIVPVYNEERAVASSVLRLKSFLEASFPYETRIVIADNASTDATLEIAQRLADRHEQIRVAHLDAKGRGRRIYPPPCHPNKRRLTSII